MSVLLSAHWAPKKASGFHLGPIAHLLVGVGLALGFWAGPEVYI
jgi:hypothetical protein